MTDESHDLLDLAARDVQGRYPQFAGDAVPVAYRGGFSGARLWRLTAPGADFCLRAWPTRDPDRERLRQIHRWMMQARQSGLSFVPPLLTTRSGATWVKHAGRLWELTAWMPGQADFRTRPTPARLEAACSALALVHASWLSDAVPASACPALFRRLDVANDWVRLLDAGWAPDWLSAGDDPVRPWAMRAWRLFPRLLRAVPRQLAGWTERRFPLQPCLCDVWHDHLLFTGDIVTGLVDYGSMKLDHIAVDLARLLGSLVADDAGKRLIGLNAYRRLRPLTIEEEALVQVLDETGAVVGLANWLKWLYRDGRQYADRAAVARKLAELVQRVEGWN